MAEFTLWIDGQPVTGEVLEKAQARTVYEQEQRAGRDAGLAEKDAYRTFDIHVHPVRAGTKRGTFMLVVTPGEDLQPIREGRDWIFILDVSGSMAGKYATLADGVRRALGACRT